MAPIRIFPPSTVANDVASVTIAGYTFASAGGAAGGILNLRISLRGSTLAELARVLARLEGVRVTSGPAIASRGDCYLVHAPGFKMVLSAPAPGGDYAPALLSRTIDSNPPKLAATCDLSAVFAGLMTAPPPPRSEEAPVVTARARRRRRRRQRPIVRRRPRRSAAPRFSRGRHWPARRRSRARRRSVAGPGPSPGPDAP